METNEQAVIAPEVTNLPARVRPVELPAIPPIPVWDEHIEALEVQASGYKCATAADFAHGKELGTKASTLKRQIEAGYAEVKRAIDAIKAPILDQEKADIAKVATLLAHVDTEAGAWAREQQRRANEKAEQERQAKIAEQKKKQEEEAALLREWGNEEEAKKVEEAPVVAPRPSTVAPAVTYRRGAKVNPKLKARIIDPSRVGRAYCVPQLPLINTKVTSYFSQIKKPTQEQIEACEREIGGIKLEWE